MRLFVAVFPPEAALSHLTAALSKADMKLVPAERLHLTLAFLGEIPDPAPALAALDAVLPTAGRDSGNPSDPAPTGEPRGSGTVPGGRVGAGRVVGERPGRAGADLEPGASGGSPMRRRRSGLAHSPLPTIGELAINGGGRFGALLWAGITGDVDGLARLARLVRRSLRAHRVRPDDKRFHPHLTVARRLSPREMAAGLAILHDYQGPDWTADEVVLVQSEMGPRPAYRHLKAWPLHPQGPPAPRLTRCP